MLFRSYLALADRFVVTAESASMLAEACSTGRPVAMFDLAGEPRERLALLRWKPAGGRYALLTGDASSQTLALRVEGVRDGLGAKWTEIPGSPVVTTGEAREAAGLLDRILLQNPDLDAVISVGAWPFLAEEAWREIATRHRDRLERARTILVVADALPPERRLVADGLGHVLVGQRPADMGARVAEVLIARANGRSVPEVVYTGFDVLTRRDLAPKR